MIAGLDVDVRPLIPETVRRGGHVRVGLEDAPFGTEATNRALVEEAVRRMLRVAQPLGIPIATFLVGPARNVSLRCPTLCLRPRCRPQPQDASTAWLAQGSQLTVLPTGPGVDDLNPTIRLMHELAEKGLADWRVALALCRIHSDADAAFARD